MECDIVTNGQEAVDIFEIGKYDIIFMDIMMPVMNGHKALQKIREIEEDSGIPSEDRVKIIMVSALNDVKNVTDAFFMGKADYYLLKPVSIGKIKESLDS